MQRALIHLLLLLAVLLPAAPGVFERLKGEAEPPSVVVTTPPEVIPPPDPAAVNPLAGKPLDYLIGASAQQGKAGRITEVGYGEEKPKLGEAIGYVNLRAEGGKPAAFAPYLPADDIEKKYGEGRPDPRYAGWEKNLRAQLDRRRAQGFSYCELDNCDSYDVATCLRAISIAQQLGLKVIAKNAGLINGGDKLLQHGNVAGHIVENGAGDATVNDTLRKTAKRPDLPTWFVAYNDGEGGKGFADRVALQIRTSRYPNMSVTFSDAGEYESSRDVQLPIGIAVPVAVQVAPKPKPAPKAQHSKVAKTPQRQPTADECATMRMFGADTVRSKGPGRGYTSSQIESGLKHCKIN